MKKNPEKKSTPLPPAQDEPDTSQIEIRQARIRAAISVSLNLLLAVGKGVAGVLGNSSALLGDAIHSATDVVASGAAYVGLWLAGKTHPSFPYGLYKAETIAALIASGAVILAGYEIGRRAILGPVTLPNVALTLPVALLSLVIAFAFGFYQLCAGRRLHSKALEADARDYLADGLSTVVVVIGLIATHFGVNLDRWAAGVVAVFICWAGGQLLWDSLRDLMDEAIDRETERKIIGLAESHPRVENVERCMSRMAGGRFIIDMDVVLRSESHDLAHRISHCLERDIRQNFSRVVMARVKTHSPQSSQLRRITPTKDHGGGPLDTGLTKAQWFLLETIDRETGEIRTREYFQNPYWEAKSRRGVLVGKWLLEFKPDQVLIFQEKGTAAVLLKEAGVELILSRKSGDDKKSSV